MLKLTDTTLVRRALQGNADAWDKLIERYERRVYNFSLRMSCNREDAMDLMQEIFLSVYRNLPSYRAEAPFAAWLFRIASHRCVDFYRRRKPAEPLPVEEYGIEDTSKEANPVGLLLRQEANQNLLALMDQLSLEQRLVVELKFLQEQTFEEMSRSLGVSANTLKSRLYGALRKMKTLTEVAHAV